MNTFEYQTCLDDILIDGLKEPFCVGRKIIVKDNTIIIKNKSYVPAELQKVVINTEGSLAIYDYSSKKLCGSISLSVSTKNIELLSLWLRKNHVPVEVISGNYERIGQWLVFTLVILTVILIRCFK